jgi:hypothetical protein
MRTIPNRTNEFPHIRLRTVTQLVTSAVTVTYTWYSLLPPVSTSTNHPCPYPSPLQRPFSISEYYDDSAPTFALVIPLKSHSLDR